jgi:hypothetical protein
MAGGLRDMGQGGGVTRGRLGLEIWVKEAWEKRKGVRSELTMGRRKEKEREVVPTELTILS